MNLLAILAPTWLGVTFGLCRFFVGRERQRCADIVRLRTVGHPVPDVWHTGQAIRLDIILGFHPADYLPPTPPIGTAKDGA